MKNSPKRAAALLLSALLSVFLLSSAALADGGIVELENNPSVELLYVLSLESADAAELPAVQSAPETDATPATGESAAPLLLALLSALSLTGTALSRRDHN